MNACKSFSHDNCCNKHNVFRRSSRIWTAAALPICLDNRFFSDRSGSAAFCSSFVQIFAEIPIILVESSGVSLSRTVN